jgi:tRNA threonylcarbamoyladenosine biosynthesis protein TsaB
LALILHIETSAEACSIALSKNGKLLSLRETLVERSHAQRITVFISEVLQESHAQLADLDAVAVSKGPGSYTGLRIGVSSAKGLCYALDKPLIGVSTLDAMSGFTESIILHPKESFESSITRERFSELEKVLEIYKNDRDLLLCPMIDARRHEVYAALYNLSGEQIRKIQADVVDENTYLPYLQKSRVLFFGPGAMKCKSLISHPNALFADQIHPSSIYMIKLAELAFSQETFEDIAYFEPYYLKDFAGSIPVKKPLGI